MGWKELFKTLGLTILAFATGFTLFYFTWINYGWISVLANTVEENPFVFIPPLSLLFALLMYKSIGLLNDEITEKVIKERDECRKEFDKMIELNEKQKEELNQKQVEVLGRIKYNIEEAKKKEE